MIDRIERILDDLDTAAHPSQLNRPSYRLHALSGDLEDFWSVRVTGNWRIVFRFDGPDVTDVRLIDYH